jgi:hypothetical protein
MRVVDVVVGMVVLAVGASVPSAEGRRKRERCLPPR